MKNSRHEECHPQGTVSGRMLWKVGIALLTLAAFSSGGRPAAGGHAPRPATARHVEIDLLPEDSENIVDPLHGDRVPLAILGSATLDVHRLDPESMRLDGMPPTKSETGSLAEYRDVDADGRIDLVMHFPEGPLRPARGAARAHLAGSLVDGQRIQGSDSIRSLQDLRMSSPRGGGRTKAAEKLPPIPVEIDVLPGEAMNEIDPRLRSIPVAILSRPDLDAASIDPASVTLAGAPVTRPPRGRWSELRDVNGDAREDLLIHVAAKALRLSGGEQDVVLDALTQEGRRVRGRDRVSPAAGTLLRFESLQPLSASGPAVDSANSSGITILDNAPASPFPSTITVSAPIIDSFVGKIRVTLKGLTHTYPADLDIMLVGPEGQSVLLMSDAAGGFPVSGVDLTFDDDAAEFLSQVTPPASGTYRPTNYDDALPDTFPAPAPKPSSSPGLAAFNSTRANGTWSLYVLDDAGQDVGVIAEGWSLEILMMHGVCFSTDQIIADNQPYFYYPNVGYASNLSGVVSKVGFRMFFSEASPDDLDILVESPSGEKVVVLSDAGGNSPVANLTLRLDDDVTERVPDGTMTTGNYQPFNWPDGLPDNFPAPAPPGPYATSFSAFRGTRANGEWRIYMVDDAPTAGNMGGLLTGLCLGLVVQHPSANSSLGPLTIPQGAPAVTAGPADPYPSEIRVAGMDGVIGDLTVEIQDLSHTYASDLDLLLVGPSGQSAVLMSDAGGNAIVTNIDLIFDQHAPVAIPDSPAGFGSGTYRPANYFENETYPVPAPGGLHGSTLAAFDGTDPNGIWRLYVMDDAGGDVGSIVSWKLNISTVIPPAVACNTAPITIPNGAPGITDGVASPYPSTLSLSGLDFPAGRVKLTLSGFSHTFPGDVDVMLVSPQGRSLLAMSDAGAGFPVSGLTLELGDNAVAPPPEASPLASGAFLPVNYDGTFSDALPAPAPPVSSAATFMDAFGGGDPNGVWSLFIQDDAGADWGEISGGWCLEVAPLFVPTRVALGIWELRWSNDSTLALGMNDFDFNVARYTLYRGTGSQLPALLNPTVDSCLRSTQVDESFENLTEVPPVGSLYWYVARGANAGGGEGSAGFARTSLGAESRVLDSSGVCP